VEGLGKRPDDRVDFQIGCRSLGCGDAQRSVSADDSERITGTEGYNNGDSDSRLSNVLY